MSTLSSGISQSPSSLGRVAILWRRDEPAREATTREGSRFKSIFAALHDAGIDTEPVVYEDDAGDAVLAQLALCQGVLVFVNPIHEGRNRRKLDSLLRAAAMRGTWVSAHPDVIRKIGTKEVLCRTRTMGWGCDTAMYETSAAMRAELPSRLAIGPRVIKRNRGNGGQGVWKVELLGSSNERPAVRILEATKEASEDVDMEAFFERCTGYFDDGSVIDQPFQPRLGEGIVRCYMAGDRCAGFGHQKVKALIADPAARVGAGPRQYTSKAEPRFQRLRRLMEDEWTPELVSRLEIAPHDLPMIWDADFMLGPRVADGTDGYVLGEINVSSVFPIPEQAPAEIAVCVAGRLRSLSGRANQR